MERVPEREVDQPTNTRKDRTEWFYERATFPLRDAAPIALEEARSMQRASTVTEFGKANWKEAGPFNIGGRMTCMAVQRGDIHDTIFAGSAGGGVWRRRSDEDKWTPIWPRQKSHNIGAIAIHPKTSTLIVATGEANLSPDSYPGTGFYVSGNGGKTWSDGFRRPDGTPLAKGTRQGLPRRVGTIALDPFNVVSGAVGSVSHDERLVSGLYVIERGRGIVPVAQFGNRSYNCHSVLFHPGQERWIYATLDRRGAESGIWRSTDSGKEWKRLATGLPSGDQFGRTSLAMAPSNPDVIYALAAGKRRQLLGVFRSRDKGDTWEPIAHGNEKVFAGERFLSYNNTIVVHPDKEDFVIWGGAHLYRRTEDGAPWESITSLQRFADAPANRNNNLKYAHEDHHALLMSRGDLVYSANDGGVAVSRNGGTDWEDWSRGLATTMFYDVDVAPSNGEVFGGGAQDNGTLIAGVATRDGKQLPQGDFIQAFPGDGGWLVFDPEDERKVFGSFQNFNILRHQHPLPWDLWVKACPRKDQMSDAERGQRAIAVLEIEPGKITGRNRRLWAGSNRLWWTDDNGLTWGAREALFDGSAISAIHVAAADAKLVFVGTTKGGIFRSTDSGETWSEDIAGPMIPRRLVTRLETHPTRSREVAATVASTGLPGAQLVETRERPRGGRKPFQKNYSNVFLSADMGDKWGDIDDGDLPNVVFHAVAFDTCRPGLIYVAGDAGVFVKFNDRWFSLTANLPNVVVSDLVFHDKDRTLTAATYGRGIWRLNTAELNFPGHPSECA